MLLIKGTWSLNCHIQIRPASAWADPHHLAPGNTIADWMKETQDRIESVDSSFLSQPCDSSIIIVCHFVFLYPDD